jgi:transposase InsO family protein
MSRQGDVWDNAAMESFFSSPKTMLGGATRPSASSARQSMRMRRSKA